MEIEVFFNGGLVEDVSEYRKHPIAILDKKAREQQWRNGYHAHHSNGKTLRIDHMTIEHLTNAINYYDRMDYDTSPLKEELAKRTVFMSRNPVSI